MAKYMDRKLLEDARKFLYDKNTNFKNLYVDLDKKRNKINIEGLKTFCLFIIPKMQNIEYLACDTGFTKRHLESLYIILKDIEKCYENGNKEDQKRLNKIKPLFKKSMGDLQLDLKYLFDYIESIIQLITFDLTSKNKFNNMIWEMRSNNMLNEEEYNLLKIFNKIRNMFIHNSHNQEDALFILKDYIPLFIIVVEDVNALHVKLIKRFYTRIILANLILGYDDFKIPNNKVYNTLNAVYAVRKQEKDLKINSLKFNIDIGYDIGTSPTDAALTKKYNVYIACYIDLYENGMDTSFENVIKAINVDLTKALLMAKNKEEEDNIRMVINTKLEPEYVADEESILRSIAKYI